MEKKYIIIGGVAGGATTAARLRRLDEKAQITIYEKGNYISYANCGLPYYIGDIIKEREKLLIQTPESFKARLNITAKTGHEVVGINRKEKTVSIKCPDQSIIEDRYDKLVLSPGAIPLIPPIEGINDPAIFTVRNVSDTDQLKNYCQKNHPRRALVAGGGFIGLEMAENLRELGIEINLAERADQVMISMDRDMAAAIHQQLRDKQINLYLGNGVNRFIRKNNTLTVELEKGQQLETDLVILSIGVRPLTKLATDAKLELANSGGIAVNDYLQTNDPDIYALGDAIAFPHPITHEPINTYLAGPANKQGRIVADNIVNGNKRKYKGSIGTAIVKIFDLTAASTGLSTKALERSKLQFTSSIIHGAAHAGYYPNALSYSLKILFNPDNGKLYGAQLYGYEGIDKRIDILASVIKNNGTIYDLEEIEHAYAPPYSSAKDPINLAGFVAENIISDKVKITHWNEFDSVSNASQLLLDVRTPAEHELGNIPNSLNIELDQLRNKLNKLPRDRKIIIYCGVGLRGYFAARILMQNNFSNVYNLSGGYKTWSLMQDDLKQNAPDQGTKSEAGTTQITNQNKETKASLNIPTIEVDACGLQCPGPIIRLKQEIDKLNTGDQLIQKATDPGFAKDVKSWCKVTGNELVSLKNEKGIIEAIIKKLDSPEQEHSSESSVALKDKTMVVFSDDLDRALASLVIANGALAMGRKVTLFFTFWGLNIIKKSENQPIKKDFMGTMFDKMMPSGAGKLKLSKMNMGGLGSLMMRKRMMTKHVDSIDDMIHTALKNGVRMIACQMSMDVMGISPEELIDGVEIGGVATYLEASEKAGLNLFI